MARQHYYVRSVLLGAFACALVLSLSACIKNGVIRGNLGNQPVQLHYQQGRFNHDGTITTVMPNGERFGGKFVVGSTSMTGVGDGGVVFGGGNNSHAAAVLTSSNGDSMHCTFTLDSPVDGLKGGGVGHCNVSTGQVINVKF